MDCTQIAQALAALPEVRIEIRGECVHCQVPALGDGVELRSGTVRRGRRILGPRGEPAVEFVLGGDAEPDIWPVIVTGDDVVFAPVDAAALLDSVVAYRVSDAPPLVAYSEMERDAGALARSCQADPVGPDLDSRAGSILLVRCLIAGAIRCGMRPVRAVGWWQQAWAAVGEQVALPPFRPDPRWEELRARAVRAAVAEPPAAPVDGPEQDPAHLGVADFARLAPVLTVARLDEEFVASWARWMPVGPARFVQVLTEGLADARAEVALYPDGGGEVDVRVDAAGTCIGLLQLGFTFPEGDLTLDEIRISGPGRGSGLFQRLMFNAEQLGALLGFDQIRVLATGIGSYALAASGYPRDPELARRLGRQR